MLLIGAGVTGLGVAMIATKTGVTETCDLFFCTVNYTLPAYITAGGAGVFAWGIMQERDAARTIRDLEAQRPPGAPTASVVVRGTAVTVGATRVAVHQSLSW